MRLVFTSNKLNRFSQMESSSFLKGGGRNPFHFLVNKESLWKGSKMMFTWNQWSLHDQTLEHADTHTWAVSKVIVWSGAKNSTSSKFDQRKIMANVKIKQNLLWVFVAICLKIVYCQIPMECVWGFQRYE